ncbi:ribosome biogenesis protein BRX1 [Ascoidea rubescens DSM 1968]|uniref:Brix-domain-containing protein n=1 Tax=Ascoidea rubescens DSM 1968 TaxID=1344418 RepID=A0A1D2VQA6_9ASCO|nr:Brix-domain-containing protein [Ascoidea rubescens DSM 1968]ODV63745.1 Brix-domain-containing protein [Ascoidea rubescens DSM 1968]
MSAIFKALSEKSSSKTRTSTKQSSINKQKVLIISSRGVTYRHRHLINDLISLLPHSKKESKVDSKKRLDELNEIADLYNCNNILYFEARKHQDLYLWLSKPEFGPTLKFHIQNIHTLDELNFRGNCLKGSRPVLSFDKKFDQSIHFSIAKELFIQAFGVPLSCKKRKPFIDHVMTFTIVDNKIWVRNYQISETNAAEHNFDNQSKGELKIDDLSLMEIGPRFVMNLIVVLQGSFGGKKIYENKEYVSPNVVRSQLKQQEAIAARERADNALRRKIKKRESVITADPLSNEAIFKNRFGLK